MRNTEKNGLDTSNVRGKEDLKHFLEKVDNQQNNGPFPTRDSGTIEELKGKLEENAIQYDNEPVTACPHCESLYLRDEDGKLECFNCGHEIAEEDVVVYKSIFSYIARHENSESTDNS